MVLDDYKPGGSLNGVAKHECCPDTRSEITKVKFATKIKYDEVVIIKVGNYDV